MEEGSALQELVKEFIDFIPGLITGIIIFVASLLGATPISRNVEAWAKERVQDPEIEQLLGRLARWSVWVIGTVLALSQVGFDVTGFVAGLGVAGLTIGFALQDVARNFVAGILLLVRQPFNIGDAVQIAGFSGSVLEIKARDTVLKTWDGEMVILSNTSVFENPIINYSLLPRRRRTVGIGLGYGQDVNHALDLFEGAIRGVEGVLDEPEVSLLVETLGDSSLQIAARFWVNQETHDLFGVHSQVVQAINRAAEDGNIELPYPVQTVRLEEAAS
ncbi:MAG: mechanosensitive ion channel [Chloroflexi bacterium]|jgi:small-conductance mechanosensitive channel|nr:mechanosensitive ion channel [Chloroflexota bacterium]